MFVVGGLVGLAILALWVFCIFDVIATDEAVVRNMPKLAWLLVVVFLPTVGAVAWLTLGRPSGAAFTTSRPSALRPPKRLGPEDDPGFLRELDSRAERLRRWEEDLRRREDDLRRRDEGP